MKYKLFITALFSLAGICINYAESPYESPQPVKIMFQVDKLPMDKGMRQNTSRNLTILAKREHDGSVKEQRLTAQLLMLSMRLDRENKEAPELNKKLSDGGSLPKADEQAWKNALNGIRRTSELLSKTNGLSEAKALDVYLQDVLVAIDGSNPIAARQEEYIKRWEGIVGTVEKEEVIAMPDVIRENNDDPDDVFDQANANNDEPSGEHENRASDGENSQEYARWKMHNSSIKLPLTFFTVEEEHVRHTEEFAFMNIKIFPRVKLDSNLMLELKPWADEEQIGEFKQKLEPMMKTQFGRYESVKVEIETDGRLSSRSLGRMMFPLTLQLKASERNIELKKGLSALGELSGTKITRNHDFWHMLKYYRKEKTSGQRMFIPVAAAADLMQLVALEEEDFFIRNEVLLAPDVDSAVDMMSESKNSDINMAAAEFAKIQAMIGEKSVGPFAVNPKIRADLEGILAKNPNHFSAKMILLRGNVSRPKKLNVYFIADELAIQLNHTSYLNERDENDISGDHANTLAKEIQEAIRNLEPLIDGKDRKITRNLTDLSVILETIARAREKQQQDENNGKRPSKALMKTVTENLAAFKLKYAAAKTEFDTVMEKLPEA